MIAYQVESSDCSTAPIIERTSVEVLAYEAPFLIEKLLKEHIVETVEEGETLFTEVKKFLILVHTNDSQIWDMYSLRIDEVWHQFILFTKQYIDFCQRFFGRYMPHSPSNAPESQMMNSNEATSFEDFQRRYGVCQLVCVKGQIRAEIALRT